MFLQSSSILLKHKNQVKAQNSVIVEKNWSEFSFSGNFIVGVL